MAAGWTAWRARARELPAGRLRAVVDELLVHVGELLAPGRAAVEAYLDAVAAEVADYLRPRVRAAVLVEDRLVADDHAHLLAEAADRGLDDRRAAAVIAELAAELGAVVEPGVGRAEAPGAPPARRAQTRRPGRRRHRPPRRRATELLRRARAALRGGRPREAQELASAAMAADADAAGGHRGRRGRWPTRSRPCWPTPSAG